MRFAYYILTLSIVLGACQELPEEDIKAWINANQNMTASHIASPEDQENFPAFKYQAKDRIDPFDSKKIALLYTDHPSVGTIYSPDMHRTRQVLEQYAIDSLRMVGTLRRPGKIIALIEVEKVLHPIHVGSYLGLDMGRVIKISEDAVQIEETTQDANGEWRKRMVEIKMKDK